MTATQILISYPKVTAEGAATLMKCTAKEARRELKEAAKWLRIPVKNRLDHGAAEVSAKQYGMREIIVVVPDSAFLDHHKVRISKLKQHARAQNILLQFQPTDKESNLKVIDATDEDMQREFIKAVDMGAVEQHFAKRHPLALD